VTLIALVLALALTHTLSGASSRPKGLPAPAGDWSYALAAPYPTAKAAQGACGIVIDARAKGVANPVLPCGVKLYIQYNGIAVLTQVIDRGPDLPGRRFDITRALARQLQLTGTKTIAWRFAR
jgi:rare lipoprotein A (peptidoglycan hydrolase)